MVNLYVALVLTRQLTPVLVPYSKGFYCIPTVFLKIRQENWKKSCQIGYSLRKQLQVQMAICLDIQIFPCCV